MVRIRTPWSRTLLVSCAAGAVLLPLAAATVVAGVSTVTTSNALRTDPADLTATATATDADQAGDQSGTAVTRQASTTHASSPSTTEPDATGSGDQRNAGADHSAGDRGGLDRQERNGRQGRRAAGAATARNRETRTV